jgi:uncharacterized membrane protein
MRIDVLWKGLPGHPLHPPLTDATIGAYTAATLLAFLDVVGASDKAAAHGWWLALLVGLAFTVPTALTGFADWLMIEWGSRLWWTATWHLTAMVSATVFFGVTAIVGHGDWQRGSITALPFVLNLIGFGVLTLGGWLGGSIVFVHGMRVLNLVEEPTDRAISPLPKPEKELAGRR